MSDIAISQDELNRLLMSAKSEKPAPSPANFNREELLKRFNDDKDQLKQMLKDYKITVTQQEVDELLRPEK